VGRAPDVPLSFTVAIHGGAPRWLEESDDSVDLLPDGRYAAVAIENERDEDVNDGQLRASSST
jgi:hypothetical protein